MPYNHPRFYDLRRLLGARLRIARQRAELTQAQVCERLGYPQTHVSKCELGQRRMDVWEVVELARLYGTPLEVLLAQPSPAEQAELDAYRRLLDEGARAFEEDDEGDWDE